MFLIARHPNPWPKRRVNATHRPGRRCGQTARLKLLPVAPVPLATTLFFSSSSLSLVQDALLSFALDSAAGPSGLHPTTRPPRRGRHPPAHCLLDRQCLARGIEEERWRPPPSSSGRDSSTYYSESLAGYSVQGRDTIPPPVTAWVRKVGRRGG